MSINRSVWQDKPGVPGTIRESPIPTKLEDSTVLIKVRAWAINPADAILQDRSLPFVKYPVILGQDVAGTVEAVGSIASSKFKVGDRIFGFTVNNGFQDYVVLDHALAAKIPASMSFAEVSVFPLCITSASFGLFGGQYLGLSLPTVNPTTSNGKSVLIWGGSSAVGSNAIQLAKAAGYDVIATCSARNFAYVTGLGASKVFDYGSPSATDDISAELDDQGQCAGIFLAMGNVADACQVAHKSKQKLFVASTNPVKPGDALEGVEVKMVFGVGGVDVFTEILPATFGGFLPEALEKGVYQVAPPPEVVATRGLEGVQVALDTLKKGVSAKKLVVVAE